MLGIRLAARAEAGVQEVQRQQPHLALRYSEMPISGVSVRICGSYGARTTTGRNQVPLAR